MEYDFGGYATKNDLVCVDGRTIKKNAFKTQNGAKVPLVWMHQRNDPENVLGHAILENREDGVYAYCKFNNSPRGKQAKLLVEHGDIDSMSIFANQLVQKGNAVNHGVIREVSLVIAPANPGALIDNPVVQHSDDGEEYEDLTQAIIHSGCEIRFDDVEFDLEHADDEPPQKTKKKKKASKADDTPDEDPDDEPDEEDPDEDLDEDPDDTTDEDEEEKKVAKKTIQHAADEDTKGKKKTEEEEDDEETVQDVYDSMTEKQKKVVAYMIGAALSSQDEDEDKAEHSAMEGDTIMPRNIFDRNNSMEMSDYSPSLTHDQMSALMDDAQKCGSLKEAWLAHAAEYGFENIDVLFPDAKLVNKEPYLIQRDNEWVAGVLNATTHVPFSRIKSTAADLTADEARAKGYVKGNMKKEEIIKLLKRITLATTIYKKQKLDRDDIVDITDLDVVAWLKAEMRVMLNEELARAILVSDGREVDDDDKINEENIRPIAKDDDMYAHHILLPADVTNEELPDEILKAQLEYKGSGNPTIYTTAQLALSMLLIKDKIGRRLYNTEAELSAAIGVKETVRVPVMEGATYEDANGEIYDVLGILVNLRDYTVGATAGGAVSMFDDFDIDFNQYKYLIETRCSGALTMPKSAVVICRKRSVSGASVFASSKSAEIG